MKINKIRIKNLNSLRSEIMIDLSCPPVSHTGLFAITGDTGAGKTTILDAITLALYGETARKQKNEIISYGAGDCYAEIEYEAKGEEYRSRWARRRARNKSDGKLQSPEMELAHLISKEDEEGKILTSSTKKGESVREKNEEITGLNFDRFCRSALLAQGDFAAFLKADEKDRSNLLESITGTEIYGFLSQAAFEQHKGEKKKLIDLKTKMEGLELPSKEEQEDEKANFKILKNTSKKLKEEETNLIVLLDWLKTISNLEGKEEQLKLAKIALNEKEISVKEDHFRLKKHQKALPFQLLSQTLKNSELRLDEIGQEIQNIQKVEHTLEVNLLQNIETQKEAEISLNKGRIYEKEMTLVFEKVKGLDIEIKAKSEPLPELEGISDELKYKLKVIDNQLVVLRESLGVDAFKLKDITTWLKENEGLRTAASDIALINDKRNKLNANYLQKISLKKDLEGVKLALESEKQKREKALSKLAEIKDKKGKFDVQFKEISPKNFALGRTDLLEHLRIEIEDADNRKRQLSQFANRLGEYQKITKSIEDLDAELQGIWAQKASLDTEIYNAIIFQEQLAEEVHLRRQLYEQQSHWASLDVLREELKEGKECPVCGSETHPYLKTGFPDKATELTKDDLKKAELDLERHKLGFQQLGAKHEVLDNNIARLMGKGNEGGLRNKLTADLEDLKLIIANENPNAVQENLAISQKNDLLEKIKNHEGDLEDKRKKREQLLFLDRQLGVLEKNYTEALGYSQNAEMEVRGLQKDLEYNEKKIKELEKEFSLINLGYRDLLSKYGYDFKENESTKEAVKELEEKNKQFAINEKAARELDQQILLQKQEKKQAEQQQVELKKRLDKSEKELVGLKAVLKKIEAERQTLFVGDVKLKHLEIQSNIEKREQVLEQSRLKSEKAKIDLSEKKTQRISLENSIKGLSLEIEKTKSELLEKIGKSIFSDLEDLNTSFLSEELAESIRAKSEVLNKAKIELDKEFRDLETSLREEREKKMTEKMQEDLLTEVNVIKEKYSFTEREIGRFEQRRKDQKDKEKQQKNLLESIEKQQKETNRWASINDLIGSSDGKKFRTFAQGLTLKQLVKSANKYLYNLHGRYKIYKSSGKDLQLEIEDQWQADSRRSMNTLSGGESFLVSLALALGLSDLAGRNTSIRSLFIDEGFGSLDEATLEDALNTLENLQATGKTIGVISHVKELKERISTQIQVSKKGSGFSEVKVVSL